MEDPDDEENGEEAFGPQDQADTPS